MNSMVGEVVRTRREERGQRVQIFSAPTAAGKNVSYSQHRFHFVVFSDDEHVHIGEDWRARMSRLINVQALSSFAEQFRIETPLVASLWPHGLAGKEPSTERELDLYKNALRKLRIEEREHDQTERVRGEGATAYLDEAIALAHPIAFRLLGWARHSGALNLSEIFNAFGTTASTFEAVARLHFLGAVKFDNGAVVCTSLGTQILEKFGFLDAETSEIKKELYSETR